LINQDQVQPSTSEQQEVVSNEKTDQAPTVTLGDISIESSHFNAPNPTQPYNPEQQHDWVRTITTCTFIGIFALTVIASFIVVIFRGSEWQNTKDLIQVLLPAETALMGSAVGFYFGSQKTN